MIRNLAVICVLTLTAITSFSVTAQAQTAGTGTVSFNNTVAKKCVVNVVNNGSLTGTPLPLATQFTTGTPGLVTAQCNSPGGVTTIARQSNSNPRLLGLVSSFSPVTSIAGTGIARNLQVFLTASDGGNVLPAGSYNFTVTVEVTP